MAGCNRCGTNKMAVRDLPPHLLPLPPPPPPRQESQDEDVDAPPRSREKTSFTDFDPNSCIEDRVLPSPLKFALDKVKRMEYVELWYFTSEGIADASKETSTAADNGYGLLTSDTGEVTFQQIKATKAARNVIVDESLSWDQIMTARIHLYAATAGWPKQHRESLAGLFLSLENLRARNSQSPNFLQALIRYQATARKRWHATLQEGTGTFDVSIVNTTLLSNIENEVRDKRQDNLDKRASIVLSQFPEHLTDHLLSRILPLRFLATLRFISPNPPCYGLCAPFPHATSLSRQPTCSSWSSLAQVSMLYQTNNVIAHSSEGDRGRLRKPDRGPGRRRSSRSKSPKERLPPRRFRRTSLNTETPSLSACPVCLSRKKHNIRTCRVDTLWDGKRKTRCTRNEDGKIVDEAGRPLCHNWNQVVGCKDGSSRHIHECSGCGESSHGAQECYLAEKAQSKNSA